MPCSVSAVNISATESSFGSLPKLFWYSQLVTAARRRRTWGHLTQPGLLRHPGWYTGGTLWDRVDGRTPSYERWRQKVWPKKGCIKEEGKQEIQTTSNKDHSERLLDLPKMNLEPDVGNTQTLNIYPWSEITSMCKVNNRYGTRIKTRWQTSREK